MKTYAAVSKLTAHDITRVAARTGIQMPTVLSHRLWAELGGGVPFDEDDPRVADLCWSLVTALFLDALGTNDLVERPRGYTFTTEVGGRQVEVHAVPRPDAQLGMVLQLQRVS